MTDARGGAFPAWSPQEDQVLRTRWTIGGYEAVRDLLPRRSYSAIVTRASTLRVKAPAHVRRKPRKYPTSEHIDRLIRDGYLAATGDKAEIRRLADRVGRPRWWVSRRALDLGLLIWFAELVPVPSFLSAGSVQSAFSSIPSSVWWALDATQADVGIPLVLGAYVARFLLRRIPVIG